MTSRLNRQMTRKTTKPALRLTPYAWAKLLFLRDIGTTEVGGFAETDPSDLLLIQDIHLVKQQTTVGTVSFEDASVADYFDAMVDRGVTPEASARIWVHTHPGHCPEPSSTDEDTFTRCFGTSDWAVMFILARGGQTYARLRFHAGPAGDILLPVEISYQQNFRGSDPSAWYDEYQRCVEELPSFHRFEKFIGGDEELPKLLQLTEEEWMGQEVYQEEKELIYEYA
ncbi:MAG: hypothetical protein U0796_02355 [Gemmatales bacterium]